MDERLPVQLSNDKSTYFIRIDGDTTVSMAYCAWCGESMDGSKDSNPLPPDVCDHIKDLAAVVGSSITYMSSEEEYWMVGSGEISVRLFFCPICGQELKLGRLRHCRRSASELAKLRELFASVKSIPRVLKEFGQPDCEYGPELEHYYWKGERQHIGCRKALSYERLAQTINVLVGEELDGTISVKFLPKALQDGQQDQEGGRP